MSITQGQTIRVDDEGTQLEIQLTENGVAVDISTQSTMDITLKRPDGTSVTRAGSFSTDGTDGKVHIITIAGDLSMYGTYWIQGHMVFSGWDGYSSIAEFEVHENLG